MIKIKKPNSNPYGCVSKGVATGDKYGNKQSKNNIFSKIPFVLVKKNHPFRKY